MKIESKELLSYILGGKAIFTVHNPISGNRFTYKVTATKDRSVHFVKVLTGRDNDNSYEYIGFIKNNQYIHGFRKSRINNSAKSVLGITWLLGHIDSLGPVEVLASGKCCRCGRTLTVPSSVSAFIGPECAKKMAA